jgi:hypothetical protein
LHAAKIGEAFLSADTNTFPSIGRDGFLDLDSIQKNEYPDAASLHYCANDCLKNKEEQSKTSFQT